MKTKLNFSLVFALLIILVATSVGKVHAQTGIIIDPGSLASAAYQTPYSQWLTATGGTEPYTFSLAGGSLPNGITLSSDGLLSGFPDGYFGSFFIGTYPISIQVVDAAGAVASQSFNLVVNKGTPTVIAYANPSYWSDPITLSAEVMMETPFGYYYNLDGTVAFYVDDIPVPGCGAVTYNGNYFCGNAVVDLAVGTHSVTAVYTPTDWYAPYYFSASDNTELTVEPRTMAIQGALFDDKNQNGVYDYDDEDRLLQDGWMVNLDQDCDGDIDFTTTTAWGGFVFSGVPISGQCHRITVNGAPGYLQTTVPEEFVPDIYTFIAVGFYYPTITISPNVYELPSGKPGEEYSQTFSASGGTEPYTYTIEYGSLPAGLTLSTDGTLSGTPTTTGRYQFQIAATDANQTVGRGYHIIYIKTDGTFTFVSSSNPSLAGEVVTFTVSATGDAVIPPVGSITFLADGTPIDGCSELSLNVSPDWQPGDYPATCTTNALEIGSHEITATYTAWIISYNDATLTMTQVVNPAVSSDLSIDKTDSKDPIKPGTKLVYTLTVSNLGPDPAENVIMTDKLDVNTTYLSISAPKGWTCSYAANSGTVTCSSNGLESGNSATIKITVVVNKTAKVGKDLVNNAFLSSMTFDPDLSNNAVVQKTMVVN